MILDPLRMYELDAGNLNEDSPFLKDGSVVLLEICVNCPCCNMTGFVRKRVSHLCCEWTVGYRRNVGAS